MASIEKARIEMFDDICELFFDKETAEEKDKRTEKYYRPIFTTAWKRDEDYNGYVLLDKGKIVGFLGAFFSERLIGAEKFRFCNLTTWKVKDEYRSESLLLLFPFLRLKTHVITALTVASFVYPVYKKLGFTTLEKGVRLIPALPGSLMSRTTTTVVYDPPSIINILNDQDNIFYKDHASYQCNHLVIHDRNRYCYMVFTFTHKTRVPAVYMHYISDVQFFLENVDLVKKEMLLKYRVPLMCIEERFLDQVNLPFSFSYSLGVPRMYKNNLLKSKDINNLYSELIAFNLFEKRFY